MKTGKFLERVCQWICIALAGVVLLGVVGAIGRIAFYAQKNDPQHLALKQDYLHALGALPRPQQLPIDPVDRERIARRRLHLAVDRRAALRRVDQRLRTDREGLHRGRVIALVRAADQTVAAAERVYDLRPRRQQADDTLRR